MKQQQLAGYRPNYPKKVLRGAALTAAALMVMAGAAGCRQPKLPELQTEGMVPMETPGEELVLDGEVAIPEPDDVLTLDGEEAIEEPELTPAPQLMTTGVLLLPTPQP